MTKIITNAEETPSVITINPSLAGQSQPVKTVKANILLNQIHAG